MERETHLDRIAIAADRLRRLPAARWERPPLAPLGARAPHASPARDGESLESLVREALGELMSADAKARGVEAFEPEVGVFSLADVLEALARSIEVSDDADALRVLADVSRRANSW